MPELPEVETVKRGLKNRLKDFYIHDVEVITPRSISSEGGSKAFVKNIIGLKSGEWTRRGKYLICSLHSSDREEIAGWWVVHLRMTGQFQWFQKKTKSCKHTRVRIWNKDGAEIRFVDTRNFGQMWWISPTFLPTEKITGLKKLGPEPFSKEFNPFYLQESLKKRKRSIKSSLLDQSIVAGAGNIYADESLFQAGILPTKESKKLNKTEIKKICTSLTHILKISIGEGGTSFKDFRDLEGVNGKYGGQAWVYGRENKPCRKCGVKILKAKVAGRGTHWCPNCQK
ncbi:MULTISPECIES: DNA-formamidopyrimidine glycosylase [Prochlorococcus]|uniref:Formamidopyrimidine-DNA glycosylase n=1 Tax=Prochlorococcus marinus (strain SARG / CCMP1375 / SS120) TaxID=167539 RepID=FPG_PROMA|nr:MULTISPECIES: DNA-formamidopyrimidine glycosylase [Prochlorococcus]Q7VDK6.3 RecName: Full=Formamidopyrimidine-DNA glycosylase; Short=Fapy-DNA glycosylase; AltName: Full=DNA-(apurinic or apyrimidinic site) lyase MutM; Short=AP lyase MutM [Prochlorococcus marinus subsp. marinus str. CCMP1375]AAP99416.1 Formamidopyrimidine-DNA glycosylase [Prochlorococcus marinus subsp. marinus str. CCMP1375]KGG11316.1 Formamidopyrimidine-DNA glycosylase [Prochlorococcus marinus str. LG]KGG18729.1 Formamidopyri